VTVNERHRLPKTDSVAGMIERNAERMLFGWWQVRATVSVEPGRPSVWLIEIVARSVAFREVEVSRTHSLVLTDRPGARWAVQLGKLTREVVEGLVDELQAVTRRELAKGRVPAGWEAWR